MRLVRQLNALVRQPKHASHAGTNIVPPTGSRERPVPLPGGLSGTLAWFAVVLAQSPPLEFPSTHTKQRPTLIDAKITHRLRRLCEHFAVQLEASPCEGVTKPGRPTDRADVKAERRMIGGPKMRAMLSEVPLRLVGASIVF